MVEKLRPELIKQSLNPKIIGSNIVIVDKVSSTQDFVFQNLNRLEKGTVVIALIQEKGRGRLGRLWYSPPDVGIYMSILFPDIQIPERNSQISLLTSLTLAKLLTEKYHLDAKIRWPNDVIVDSYKIGGILVEQKENVVVVGIGVNVNNNVSQLPEGASSLYLVTGKIHDRNIVIARFLKEYDFSILQWKKEGFNYIRRLWLQYSSLKGQLVKAEVDSHFVEGIAEDLDDDCSLIIRNSHGYLLKIHVSNVIRVR
ncbi:MAG TPA: biotin--[acetyl-CoA-carboxylase] ligase [Candidatus Omnitrophica bacterium]|nr:biotin--[acetyl-CoA-carboxylase] ligase [Candidatus Omnitrophota bacterium]